MKPVFRTVASAALAASLLLAAWPAAAQWTGKGEAGLAIATGNTETKTANARVAVGRKVELWELTGTLAGLYVRNDGETTARRWEVTGQGKYNFSPRTFSFAAGRYERDLFSGFRYQSVVNGGLGHRFLDSNSTKLSAQIGVGYKFFERLDVPTDPDMDEDNRLVGVAGLEFTHQISDTTSLYNRFGAEVNAGSNFLQNEIGVTVKVLNRIALSLAYGVRHNTDPPLGFRKTDTLSTVNLVYEVK